MNQAQKAMFFHFPNATSEISDEYEKEMQDCWYEETTVMRGESKTCGVVQEVEGHLGADALLCAPFPSPREEEAISLMSSPPSYIPGYETGYESPTDFNPKTYSSPLYDLNDYDSVQEDESPDCLRSVSALELLAREVDSAHAIIASMSILRQYFPDTYPEEEGNDFIYKLEYEALSTICEVELWEMQGLKMFDEGQEDDYLVSLGSEDVESESLMDSDVEEAPPTIHPLVPPMDVLQQYSLYANSAGPSPYSENGGRLSTLTNVERWEMQGIEKCCKVEEVPIFLEFSPACSDAGYRSSTDLDFEQVKSSASPVGLGFGLPESWGPSILECNPLPDHTHEPWVAPFVTSSPESYEDNGLETQEFQLVDKRTPSMDIDMSYSSPAAPMAYERRHMVLSPCEVNASQLRISAWIETSSTFDLPSYQAKRVAPSPVKMDEQKAARRVARRDAKRAVRKAVKCAAKKAMIAARKTKMVAIL